MSGNCTPISVDTVVGTSGSLPRPSGEEALRGGVGHAVGNGDRGMSRAG